MGGRKRGGEKGKMREKRGGFGGGRGGCRGEGTRGRGKLRGDGWGIKRVRRRSGGGGGGMGGGGIKRPGGRVSNPLLLNRRKKFLQSGSRAKSLTHLWGNVVGGGGVNFLACPWFFPTKQGRVNSSEKN